MSVRTPVDIIGDEAVAALMSEGWVIRRTKSSPSVLPQLLFVLAAPVACLIYLLASR